MVSIENGNSSQMMNENYKNCFLCGNWINTAMDFHIVMKNGIYDNACICWICLDKLNQSIDVKWSE
jgi:hypothetical protein